MSSTTAVLPRRRLACYYRPALLVSAALALLCLFWFSSRYPSLFKKADHLGQQVPSMAFSGEVWRVASDAPALERIAASAVNWLDGMKIGMSFGVLFGALLHTWLRYYPLRIGRNLTLNALKGAAVGVPMGVCANCSVPAACGVTRGHGRVEVALGFLFSSPNFNPIVVAMTFTALPLSMSLAKYGFLLFVILGFVPWLIGRLERGGPLPTLTAGPVDELCAVPLSSTGCEERFLDVLREVGRDFLRHAWMLVKPTIVLMLIASLLAAALLVFVPWTELLADMSPGKAALLSLLSVFMPVPIALDVMFAAQLQAQAVPAGYVMLFLTTLGTFSVIPATYLWREISRRLALALFGLFALAGFVFALAF